MVFVRQRDASHTLARYRSEIREIVDGPNALAQLELGKAIASVSLNKNECQWGSYDKNQAGILQFHTSRFEPRGCKLRDLNVKLTFDGTAANGPNGAADVYLLSRPIPESIKGGKSTREEKKGFVLEPSIPTPMGNFALGRLEKRTKAEIEDAWTYSSQWMRDGQLFRSAVWQWQARDASLQLEDVGDLHGGVVVCHDGEPFYICCDVEGKLLSNFKGRWSNRRWYLFKSKQIDTRHQYRVVPDLGNGIDLKQQIQDLELKVLALFGKSRAITL